MLGAARALPSRKAEASSMQVFPQNVIAMVWDFDWTLIRGHMQAPLFRDYGIDPDDFWAEVDGLPERYGRQGLRVARDSAYLNHLLTYAWAGRLDGLGNDRLRSYGASLEFYEGMPEFLEAIAAAVEGDRTYRRHDIRVEHYIVSTGLRQIIEGSAVRGMVRDVWASEFIEAPLGPGRPPRPADGGASPPVGAAPALTQVGYAIDNTTKTRALFEINKGVNAEPEIDVNDRMAEGERRVPFGNMICVADGPSDVPMFSVVNRFGGKAFAVYDPSSERHFDQVSLLVEQQRVITSFPADYRGGSEAWLWLHRAAREIADGIVQRRDEALRSATAHPPAHVGDGSAPRNGPAAEGTEG